MNPLSVSARKLHGRPLRLRDRLINDASLFPFFDQGGRCQWVMVVSSFSSEIWVMPWRRQLFHVPLWGPIVCTEGAGILTAITEEQAQAVQALWHYDPWWVLDEDLHATHWATSLLKETNCAEQLDPGVRMVFFRRDLSRLSWVYLKRRASTSFVAWNSDYLRPRRQAPQMPPAQPAIPRRAPVWQLDPIWKPWTNR